MLDLVENAVPGQGGYRGIRDQSPISVDLKDASTGEPFQGINGAIGHVFLVSSQDQKETPASVSGTPDFFKANDAFTQDDLQDYVNSETSDTTSFVCAGGGEDGAITFVFSEFETPTSGSNWELSVTYRVENNQSGTWSVDYELFNGATSVDSGTVDSGTGDGSGGWKTEVVSIPTLTGYASYDYSDIRVEFTTTVNDGGTRDTDYAPSSDVSNGGSWRDESGNLTDLYQSIDESSDDDNDFIKSPNILSSGSESVYRVAVAGVEDPCAYYENSYSPSPFLSRFRAKTPHSNVKCGFRLYDNGGNLVREDTISDSIATSYTNYTRSHTYSSIEEFGDLEYELYAYIEDDWKNAAGVGTAEPDSYVNIFGTAWRVDDSSSSGSITTSDFTGDYTDVDDTNDGNEIVFPDSGLAGGAVPSATFVHADFLLSDYDNPGINYNWDIVMIARETGGTSHTVRVSVVDQAGSVVISEDFLIGASSSDTTYTWHLSDSDIAAINGISGNKYIRVQKRSFDLGFRLESLYLSYPEPARIFVSRLYLEAEGNSRASLAWTQLKVPSSNSNYDDDLVTVYAGDNSRLFRVDADGFTNFTRGVVSATENLYANSTDPARPWDFAPFGNSIIATNYVDPVQWYEDGSANEEFTDLITSTAAPTARFVGVCRDQLVLAHCNGTGDSESFSDTVWWSHLGDPTDFDPSVTFLSDKQRLVDTPGQITGFVPGNYGLVFKRNSIYRMQWDGFPYAWEFKLPSPRIGSPYPKSIVQVGSDVFFYSDGGFAVIEKGEKVSYLNDTISDFVGDPDFSPQAFSLRSQTTGVFDDLAVIGTYDAKSRLIFWFYAGPNSTYSEDSNRNGYQGLNDAVVLDTKTGKWGYLNLLKNATADWNAPNVTASIPIYKPDISSGVQNSGSAFFGWQSALFHNIGVGGDAAQAYFQFSSSDTLPSSFRTKIVEIEEGKHVKILKVQPVFSKGVNSSNVNMEITVSGYQDPQKISEFDPFTTSKRDRHGWYLTRASGQWFEFTFNIEGGSDQFVNSFVGYSVEYDIDGNR